MTAVITAEWVKLRSVRSSYLTVGTVALAGALAVWLTLDGVRTWDGWGAERRAEFAASSQLPGDATIPWIGESTFIVGHLALAVLGVLAASSEYATGTAPTSLLATPRRLRWMLAKTAAVAGFASAIAAMVLLPTALAAYAIVGDRSIAPPYAIANSVAGAVGQAGAGVLVATTIALVGLGLGLALRSTVAALVAATALQFLPSLANGMMPGLLGERITSVLLTNLAGQLAGSPYTMGDLAPSQALGVLACYLVVALGSGAAVLHRRDAG